MTASTERDTVAILKRTARRPWAAFAGVYMSYGATFGIISGGVPLVLRAHGLPLADVGFLQLVYLPIGLAFVWAPLVDRFAIAGIPQRIGWIGAGMSMTSLLLATLGLTTDWPVVAIFCLALGVSVAMATADVALEALVVETVAAADRPFVTTAKLTGSSVGTMVGVGLATTFPDHIGLPTALLVVAGLDLVLLVPLFTYPEPRQRRAGARPPRSPQRTRMLLRRAGVLGLFFAPAIFIVSIPNLVLLDLKLSLPVVGFFTGTLTTVVSVAMTLASGAAMTRIPAYRLVAALAAGVVLSAFLLALAVALSLQWLGFAAATLIVLFEGGLGVPVFNIVYKWAEGEHAATDYAFLFGVAFLVSFPARVLGPMLAGAIGWPIYFLVLAPVYAVAVAVLVITMRETPGSSVTPR